MYAKGNVKEKLKRTAVSVFYSVVLFAELGEFFVFKTTRFHNFTSEGETQTSSSIEIPAHLSESVKGLELCVGNKCRLISKIETNTKHSILLGRDMR